MPKDSELDCGARDALGRLEGPGLGPGSAMVAYCNPSVEPEAGSFRIFWLQGSQRVGDTPIQAQGFFTDFFGFSAGD